jgi:hypothetical protein
VRVVQGNVSVDARSPDVFLPSAFDASRPFDVEFTVPPGEIHLDLSVLVGVPRR